MNIVLSIPASEEWAVSFKLSRFIDDWPSAQQKFIAGITRAFHGFLDVRPQNLSANSSPVLGDAYCRCQLFGGACTLTLNPEMLHLQFANIHVANYGVMTETIRRSLEMLSADFGDRGREWSSVSSNAHVLVVGPDTADAYLEQFAYRRPAEAIGAESGIEYQPSALITIADENRNWYVRRSIEKSELSDNDLFISTNVHIVSFQSISFDDQLKLVERIYALSDRASGIRYEGNGSDESAL